MIRSFARFSCLMITIATPISWAAPTLIQFDVDSSRSAFTWDIKFTLGNLVVPFGETSPGSLTSPLDGDFNGFFNPSIDQLFVSAPSQPIFQPDTRLAPPSSNLNLLSSVNGTITIPGLASGIASARLVRYGFEFSINDFRPDEIPIGTTLTTSPFNLRTNFRGFVDYNFTGLFNTFGTIPIDLPNIGGSVTATYTRLGKNTGEFSILNLDRPVSFSGLDFGGIFVPGTFQIKGNVVTKISFVPETSSWVMSAMVTLLLLAGAGAQYRQQRTC